MNDETHASNNAKIYREFLYTEITWQFRIKWYILVFWHKAFFFYLYEPQLLYFVDFLRYL